MQNKQSLLENNTAHNSFTRCPCQMVKPINRPRVASTFRPECRIFRRNRVCGPIPSPPAAELVACLSGFCPAPGDPGCPGYPGLRNLRQTQLLLLGYHWHTGRGTRVRITKGQRWPTFKLTRWLLVLFPEFRVVIKSRTFLHKN